MTDINLANKNFNPKVKISELRMEILDKKSNRMSRVIVGVFEANLLAILESLNELVHLEFLTDAEITANS